MKPRSRSNMFDELVERWNHQVGARIGQGTGRRSRLGAVGYLAGGAVIEGLVELTNLLLVVLYGQPVEHGAAALHVAGFGAEIVPWGIEWGGATRSRFLKDLLQQPGRNARGRCISHTSVTLLQLALELDQQLWSWRCRRHLAAERLRLPSLWAGFQKSVATEVTAQGPELERFCCRTNCCTQDAIERVRREHFGLSLYPLEWVSQSLPAAVTVFADMGRAPAIQVFKLRRPSEDLVGYVGAVHYDFANTRFGRRTRRSSHRCKVA